MSKTSRMENQMEKPLKNSMEAGAIWVFYRTLDI